MRLEFLANLRSFKWCLSSSTRKYAPCILHLDLEIDYAVRESRTLNENVATILQKITIFKDIDHYYEVIA